jgi:hypothetical protein
LTCPVVEAFMQLLKDLLGSIGDLVLGAAEALCGDLHRLPLCTR